MKPQITLTRELILNLSRLVSFQFENIIELGNEKPLIMVDYMFDDNIKSYKIYFEIAEKGDLAILNASSLEKLYDKLMSLINLDCNKKEYQWDDFVETVDKL